MCDVPAIFDHYTPACFLCGCLLCCPQDKWSMSMASECTAGKAAARAPVLPEG